MADHLRQPKLTKDHQLKVCQWLAEFKLPGEIAKLCQTELGVQITPQAISINYVHGKKWQPIVQQLRERFLTDLAATPIANKRVRLERLEELYQQARSRKDKLALQHAIAALKQAQDEGERASHVTNVLALTNRQEIHLHDYAKMDKEELMRHLNAKLAAERGQSG